MDNIINYIKENRIIILLLIIVCFMMYFYYNDQQPHVENMVQVTSESTINNISKYVGQNIYLSYKRSDGNTYYLGNLAANNCLDLQKKSDGSCLTNVAIIQE